MSKDRADLDPAVGKRLEEVRAVLFDVDGTLVDTIDLIIETFHQVFNLLGIPDRTDAEILSWIGKPLYLQVRELHEERAEEIYRLYKELYERNRPRLARELPGMVEALRALRDRGYRLGVVTSKRNSSTLRELEDFGFSGLFEVVITAEHTANHKPHPEPLEKALEELGVGPERATYVGDSPYDIRSARGAGVLAGAVRWSRFPEEALEREQPDYWVNSPAHLLELFPGFTGP
ncbi:MAG: HAD-IA family hydrolase [Candidatus Geothermincolales bacterium]